MTCETCIHWLPEDPQHIIDGFGACGRMRAAMFSPDHELDNDLAVVIDGAGARSALKCKAAFGCVMHEAA